MAVDPELVDKSLGGLINVAYPGWCMRWRIANFSSGIVAERRSDGIHVPKVSPEFGSKTNAIASISGMSKT